MFRADFGGVAVRPIKLLNRFKKEANETIFGRKKLMKKRILASLVALATVMSFAGCQTNNDSSAPNSGNDSQSTPDNSTPDNSTPDDSNSGSTNGADTLSILTWNGNSDTKTMIEFFLESKGYDSSKVTFVGVGDNGEGARDGYKQYLQGDGDADLMIFDADWVADYINDDSLTAGYDTIGLSKSDFPDAFGYTLSNGTSETGVFKANSFQATPGGFVYRADLAEQYLGVTTPDEMQALVSDWDKFQAAGQTVNEVSGGACSIQATEGGLWQVFQSNRTQPWVVDGKLVMDTAEDFYDIAKGMLDNKSLANVPQWDAAWYAAILDGTAMGDFVPTWGLTTNEGSILFNFTEGKEENGAKMAICEGPTGWYWGGSYIGVSTKCNNPELAKEFIEFYCKNADNMKAYAEKTGDFVNSKAVMSELTASNKLLNGQNHYEVLTKVMDKLDLEGKITKYDSVIKGKFNDSVNGYLDGTFSTKEEAIESFKNNVAAALPDIVVE